MVTHLSPLALEAAPPQPETGLHLAFATMGDARQHGLWSGTPKAMAEALARAGHTLSYIGPITHPADRPLRSLARLLRPLGLSLPAPYHMKGMTSAYGRRATQAIGALAPPPDWVLAVAGSAFAGALPPGLRLAYISDATFRLIAGYHPHYRQLPRRAAAVADALEAAAIARADLVFYPSDWAARSAILDYGAAPDKIRVIPWGANLAPPAPPTPSARAEGPIRLLFVGVNWAEKGAAVAVETLAALQAQGLEATLTICGCTPPAPLAVPGLTIIPFLRKSVRAEAAALEALYRRADFFLLPTRADCFGIVFCEAAAYGLPSLAPATGGVPSAVATGENGILLPEGAGGGAYAAAIAALWADPAAYAALRVKARARYEKVLNWDAWAARLSAALRGAG
jgi:glycosyltransferase involved in cell wall biosynthesis